MYLFRKIISYINKVKYGIKIKSNKKMKYPLVFAFILLIFILFIMIIWSKFHHDILFISIAILLILIFILIFHIYYKYLSVIDKKVDKSITQLNEYIENKVETINIDNIVSKEKINRLILKDNEDYDIKIWDIYKQRSISIGKNNKKNNIDIDLSDNEYASLISRTHGVINKVNDKWYYEDLDSKNGSSICKYDGRKYHLSPFKPIKLDIGDILYISVIKILIN